MQVRGRSWLLGSVCGKASGPSVAARRVAGRAAAARHNFPTSFRISSLCPRLPRRPRPSTGSLSLGSIASTVRGTGPLRHTAQAQWGCMPARCTGALGAGHVRPWERRTHLTPAPPRLWVHAATCGCCAGVAAGLRGANRATDRNRWPQAGRPSATGNGTRRGADSSQQGTERGAGGRTEGKRGLLRIALPPPSCSSAPTALTHHCVNGLTGTDSDSDSERRCQWIARRRQ